MKNKAVFLDRDGTINEEVNYLKSPDEIRILPGVAEALLSLKNSGFLNIIVTNQSGIARGYFTENDLDAIHKTLASLLVFEGKQLIDDILYSPYHPEGVVEKYRTDSRERKPGTGMIDIAAAKHKLDLKESFLVGDSFVDMQCASNAGVRMIMVMTGYGRRDLEKCGKHGLVPDHVAEDLPDAARFITGNKNF